MRTKGKFFWRKSWYSICSVHFNYKNDCGMCNAGSWHYDILSKIDGIIHDHWYSLWFYWHNRPNSSSKKRLRKWFPNLK